MGVHANDVIGKMDGFARGQKSFTGIDLIRLEQRVADGFTLGCEEGEAHRSANDERVDEVEQGLDNTELVGNLCATEYRDEGALGLVAKAEKYLDLFLHQETHCRRQSLWRSDN